MSQKFVEVLDLGYGSKGNHGCIPKSLHSKGWIYFYIERLLAGASDLAPAYQTGSTGFVEFSECVVRETLQCSELSISGPVLSWRPF